MKTKKNLIIGVLAISLTLVSATAVFADVETPGNPGWGMGTPIDASLDDYVIPAMADLFNMSEEEVTSALDSGATFSSLALAAGYSFDEIAGLLESVHTQALDQAIAEGAITPDQAERLSSVQMGANGRGRMGNTAAPRLYPAGGLSVRRGGRW